jgi:hypothetical protein
VCSSDLNISVKKYKDGFTIKFKEKNIKDIEKQLLVERI